MNLRDDLQALLRKDATKGLAGGFLWGMQEWEAPFVELFWVFFGGSGGPLTPSAPRFAWVVARARDRHPDF
jgi:hypothetical protein